MAAAIRAQRYNYPIGALGSGQRLQRQWHMHSHLKSMYGRSGNIVVTAIMPADTRVSG